MIQNGIKTYHLEYLSGRGHDMIQNGTKTDHSERLSGFGSEMVPFRAYGAFQASFNNPFRWLWAFQASSNNPFRKRSCEHGKLAPRDEHVAQVILLGTLPAQKSFK